MNNLWIMPLLFMACAVTMTACTPTPTEPTISASDTAKLLPNRKQDKAAWANDIHKVFDELKISATSNHLCTAIAIIDQESNFDADPSVPNLGKSSLDELDARLDDKLGATLAGVFRQMLATRPSVDNNFRKQILAVKTERQLDELYRTMFAYFADNYKVGAINAAAKSVNQGIDERLNPITTLGSMQVHIDYAKAHRRTSMDNDALRSDLYSRYGGLYYGIHRLMLYPSDYDKAVYRFADYNAGMYSSRNAALQSQIAKLSGQTLSLDGDLLLYKGSHVKDDTSQTESAIIVLLPKLNAHLTADKPLSVAQIRRDLKKEKSQDFEKTATYQAIKSLYQKTTGKAPSYAIMPKVAINSPKLKNSYDTNWYATSVQKRYDACMTRAKEQKFPLE